MLPFSALPAQTPVLVKLDGGPEGAAMFRMYGVTASDTVELSTWFKKVYWWAWVPATGTSTAADSTVVATNTKITLPATIAVDDGWVFCVGAIVAPTT